MGINKFEKPNLWWDFTFNAWWGCEKVSPACKFCYAERDSLSQGDFWGANGNRRFFGDKHWNDPIRWNRKATEEGTRKKVFCLSMGDIFEDRRDLDSARLRVFTDLVPNTPNLDWMFVTKRIEKAMDLVPSSWRDKWPDNAWVITSIENQDYLEKRMPYLSKIPARVRGISAEPLCGPVDFTGWENSIEWMITGGESGDENLVRIAPPDWYRGLRDWCIKNNKPFYFKQWGEYRPLYDGEKCEENVKVINGIPMVAKGKKKAGYLLDGKSWFEFPKTGLSEVVGKTKEIF